MLQSHPGGAAFCAAAGGQPKERPCTDPELAPSPLVKGGGQAAIASTRIPASRGQEQALTSLFGLVGMSSVLITRVHSPLCLVSHGGMAAGGTHGTLLVPGTALGVRARPLPLLCPVPISVPAVSPAARAAWPGAQPWLTLPCRTGPEG